MQFGSAILSNVSADQGRVDGILAGNPDVMSRLRQVLVYAHLIGPTQSGDVAIRDYVRRQLANPLGGTLIAILLPPESLSRGARQAGAADLPQVRPPAPGKSVKQMSPGERIFAMFTLAQERYFGPELKKVLADTLASLTSPEAMLTLVACLTLLAAAQAAGVGEVADALLLSWAYATLGWSGLCAMWRVLAALVEAATASDDAALDDAARRFGKNLAKLGADVLLIFLTWAIRRAARSKASSEDGPSGGRQSGGGRSSSGRRVPNPLYDDPSGLVRSRVGQLQDQIPAGAKGRITMAVGVVQDASGGRSVLVATSEPRGYLRPGVSLDPSETMVPGTGHAEADIANYASANNLDLVSVGATRPVCAGCQDVLGPTGADIATPLK